MDNGVASAIFFGIHGMNGVDICADVQRTDPQHAQDQRSHRRSDIVIRQRRAQDDIV